MRSIRRNRIVNSVVQGVVQGVVQPVVDGVVAGVVQPVVDGVAGVVEPMETKLDQVLARLDGSSEDDPNMDAAEVLLRIRSQKQQLDSISNTVRARQLAERKLARETAAKQREENAAKRTAENVAKRVKTPGGSSGSNEPMDNAAEAPVDDVIEASGNNVPSWRCG